MMSASSSHQSADMERPACSNSRRPPHGRPGVAARHLCALFTAAVLLSVLASPAAHASAADCLRPQDDFFLINVRGLGTRFGRAFNWERVLCRRLARMADGSRRRWITVSIDDFYAADDPAQLTLVFVHGNRVDPGEDVTETLSVYRALIRCTPHAPPIRLVCFSWPTERIRGLVKDYREKARRADPAALRLAWVLSRLRSDVPVSLLGYSYGGRVVGGALHLVAGGTLCGHALPAAANLANVRVVQIAAAVDRTWLLPGRTHGMAMQVVGRIVLINNHCDPAMRLYHVSSPCGRPVALGRYGMPRLAASAAPPGAVCQIDACGQVGKHHALKYYLGSGSLMKLAGRELLQQSRNQPQIITQNISQGIPPPSP